MGGGGDDVEEGQCNVAQIDGASQGFDDDVNGRNQMGPRLCVCGFTDDWENWKVELSRDWPRRLAGPGRDWNIPSSAASCLAFASERVTPYTMCPALLRA